MGFYGVFLFCVHILPCHVFKLTFVVKCLFLPNKCVRQIYIFSLYYLLIIFQICSYLSFLFCDRCILILIFIYKQYIAIFYIFQFFPNLTVQTASLLSNKPCLRVLYNVNSDDESQSTVVAS